LLAGQKLKIEKGGFADTVPWTAPGAAPIATTTDAAKDEVSRIND
jgi:hypothetical protein